MSTYTDEVWKDTIYPPGYMVSSIGRIRNKKGKIMKTSITEDEYHRVCLCKNGKQIHKLVAVLVAKAFIPNPEHLPTVDHINHDKNDNRVSNLRHATQSQQNANKI